MKTKRPSLVVLLAALISLTGCQKDDAVTAIPTTPFITTVANRLVKTWTINNLIIRTDQGEMTLTEAPLASLEIAFFPNKYTFTDNGNYVQPNGTGTYKLLEDETKLSLTSTGTSLLPSRTTTLTIQLPSLSSLQLSSNAVVVNPLSSSASADDQLAAEAALSVLKALGNDPITYKSIQLSATYDRE